MISLVLLLILLEHVLPISSHGRVTSSYANEMNKINETTEDNRSIVEAYPSWVLLCTQIMPTVLFIDRYFTLISYILGFPGNIIASLVWTSRCMYRGNSAAIYLAALSINDLVVLLMALVRDLNRVWDVPEYFFPGYCEIKMTITPAVQYSSPLFVLGFTVERWLAICRPFAIDRICSARRAIYICISIITVTTIICSGNAYIFVTKDHYCEKRDPHSTVTNAYLYILEGIFSGMVPTLVLIFNCLVIRELARIHQANKRLAALSNRLSNTEQIKIREKSCFGKYCPTKFKNNFSLTPSCCKYYHNQNENVKPVYRIPFLSETNKCQVSRTSDDQTKDLNRNLISTRSSHSRIGEPFKSNRTESGFSDETRADYDSHHNPSFRSTTIMLLVVSFYMIITTMLGGLVYAVHQGSEVPSLNLTKKQVLEDPVWANYMNIMLIKTIGDEIALSHYAMGFIIYYATGRNFRQRVHQLLKQVCLRLGLHCNFITKLGVSEDYDLSSTRRRTQKRLVMNDERLIDPSRLSDCRNSMIKESDYLRPKANKRENGTSINVGVQRTTRRPKTDLLRRTLDTNENTTTTTITTSNSNNNNDKNDVDENCSRNTDPNAVHLSNKASVDSKLLLFPFNENSID